MIYFDEAATSRAKPEVVEAMIPYLSDFFYNPSSIYRPAVAIHDRIEGVREQIAAYIGANPSEIYFTSGGSESNNWAIQGYVSRHKNRDFDDLLIVTTPLEHASIELLVNDRQNIWPRMVRVDKDGKVDLDSLHDILKAATRYYTSEGVLVSIQMANNEIGTIQDMKAIADICHEFGVALHTDAVQAFGQVPIDVHALGVDMLSASGHKIGAPKGIGFLYIRDGFEIDPLVYGTQERGNRGGTQNVAGIVGFGKALELVEGDKTRESRVRTYRASLTVKLLSSGCRLNGHPTDRLPNNVSITLPDGVLAESMIYMLDAAGILVSAGSACHGHSTNQSSTLRAIGQTEEESLRVLRLTLPDDVTIEQIDTVAQEIDQQIKLLSSVS